MSEESKRRDFGIAFAAAGTAVLEFLIFAIGSAWPDAVWRSSMTDTALLIPVLTFVGSLVAATFMRSHPQVAEVTVGVVIAVALYASVQGVSYYDATNDERQAEQAAAQWPVALSQDFSHVTGWNPNSSQPASFGTLQTTVVNGQFLIRLTPSETPLARLSLADRRTRLAARMSSTSDYRDKTVNAFSVTLSAQGWRIPGLTTKCASIGAEAVRIAVARRV
jgi:hypothetical protein